MHTYSSYSFYTKSRKMDTILEAFEDNHDTSLESLLEEAIQTGKTGYIRWVLSNDQYISFDIDEWSDYIHEYSIMESLKLFHEMNFEFDLNKLAEFGQLEMLELIYEETEELPDIDGYNSALKNEHLGVVEWFKEVAIDTLFE